MLIPGSTVDVKSSLRSVNEQPAADIRLSSLFPRPLIWPNPPTLATRNLLGRSHSLRAARFVHGCLLDLTLPPPRGPVMLPRTGRHHHSLERPMGGRGSYVSSSRSAHPPPTQLPLSPTLYSELYARRAVTGLAVTSRSPSLTRLTARLARACKPATPLRTGLPRHPSNAPLSAEADATRIPAPTPSRSRRAVPRQLLPAAPPASPVHARRRPGSACPAVRRRERPEGSWLPFSSRQTRSLVASVAQARSDVDARVGANAFAL